VAFDDPRMPRAVLTDVQQMLGANWRERYTAPSMNRPSSLERPLFAEDGFVSVKDEDPVRGRLLGRALLARAKYPWQWLWDSAFHCRVYSDLGQSEHARTELMSLLALQRPDGFIPNNSKRVLGILAAQITQPPILGEVAFHMLKADGSLPEGAYEKLKSFHEWLAKQVKESNGLFAVRTGLESGNDNSPVYDEALWGQKKGGRLDRTKYVASRAVFDGYGTFAPEPLPRPSIQVKPVLFNALYARDLEAMWRMAERLEQWDDAAVFKGRYDRLRAAMRAQMRVSCPEDPDGEFLFFSLERSGAPILTKTVELFLPLAAGLLDAPEAAKLVAYLTDKTNGFWTEFPVPSAAATEENERNGSYSPTDYWRGPTWVNTNALILEGLLRYGYYDLACELYDRTVKMIEANRGPMAFNEGYHPRTGQAVRQGQFSWSAMVVSMLHALREYEDEHGITPRAA
jgi:hypothetical protein